MYVLTPKLAKWRGWRRYGAQVLSHWAAFFEGMIKRNVFDCRMCGQCVLSYKGMTCPMRCPKNMRNGPCGGVREGDRCEVFPDRPCVHVLGWRRANALGQGSRWALIQPMIDSRLVGTSSWVNHVCKRDAGVYGPLHEQLRSSRHQAGSANLES